MKLDDLLGKFNLDMDDLNADERKTLNEWMGKLQRQVLTVADVQAHVASLIAALEREISGLDAPPTWVAWMFERRRQSYLRARLKNYLMLQDFLLGPERAKKWIEQQLAAITQK